MTDLCATRAGGQLTGGHTCEDVPRKPIDEAHSNVTAASNVFVRIDGLPRHHDIRFRIEVRGVDAIKEVLQDVPGLIDWTTSLGAQAIPILEEEDEMAIRSMSIGTTDNSSFPFGLTRYQAAQVVKQQAGCRCKRCGRINFGQKRQPDGRLVLGFVRCMCQRASDTQPRHDSSEHA